ncbi:MAG: hypothetical protein EON60_04420 [Alphaproteobacteria bacterium]|nr:MAG: hypothetical protein EON60_04420 [Alphaproteobacteria bacterium]
MPRPPRLGWRGRSLLAFCLAGSAYALGFALYVVTLPQPFTTLPEDLEGLATFTGGSGRVETALKQVQRGFDGPILISGSHQQSRLTDILALTDTPLTPSQQEHIVYDAAQTTRENVTSLQAWAGYNHISRIGLVTSTYHVPRVRLLALFHARSLSITYLPVQPADPGLRTLFREYNKLIIAPILQ